MDLNVLLEVTAVAQEGHANTERVLKAIHAELVHGSKLPDYLVVEDELGNEAEYSLVWTNTVVKEAT